MKLHTGESLTAATANWSWEQRQALGQQYLSQIAGDILKHWKDGPEAYQQHVKEPIETVKRALELDGYQWDGSRLIVSETDVLDTAEEAGVIRTLYRELHLAGEEITFHHLQLTEDHYLEGRWDDTIANSRKFFESTLAQVAARLGSVSGNALASADLARPARVRDFLSRERLLEEKEKQAVASVYGLLSETGGHPYVAQQEQARLMRHLSLTFVQFVMLRLRSALAAA